MNHEPVPPALDGTVKPDSAQALLRSALRPRNMFAYWRLVHFEDPVVTWLALTGALLALTLIGWDLPSTISWENDGVAPHSYLNSVIADLTWGKGDRYPLFHNLTLALFCSPVLLISLLAGPFTVSAINERLCSVPTLTAVSLIIKLVAVAMGVGSTLLIARIARRIFGTIAGRATALFALTSLTVSYYARTSNLDGPYLLYTVIAIDRLLSALETGERKDYLLLGLSIAAALATKDQAFASFVLVLPIYGLILPAMKLNVPAAASRHYAWTFQSLLTCIIGYAVLAGVVVNPTGFVTRLRLLTGPNSEEWRQYARSLDGVLLNLRDLWANQTTFFWHGTLVAVAWLGVVVTIISKPTGSTARRALQFLPLVAAISSLVAFTLPVARCEHRFALPFGFWLCVYGGYMTAWLWQRRPWAWPGLGIVGVGLSLSAWKYLVLAMTQLGDARFDVERELSLLHAPSVVEMYGFRVHQPRIDNRPDAPYRVVHVGKEPLKRRPKIPGFTEVLDDFGNVSQRSPDVLVITEGFAERFLERSFRHGEAPSVQWLRAQADSDAVEFFRVALHDRLPGYRLKRVFTPQLPAWMRHLSATPTKMHDLATGGSLYWFERTTPKLP